MSVRSFELSDETPTNFDRPGIYFPRRPNPPSARVAVWRSGPRGTLPRIAAASELPLSANRPTGHSIATRARLER